MIHVVDTHPLVWHLEANRKLSVRASAVLSSADASLVIPSIVLAEVWYLYEHKRIRTSPDEVRRRILASRNCSVYPLDEAVLDCMPAGLDIHDGIIVATALLFRDVLQQPTSLITRDRPITESGLVEVVW